MSSLAFLVTELQALASETRRRHPDVREAAEKSLAILRASPEQATARLAADGPQSDDLLRPVFMGCATKNAKVVAISLGSLQRLIALKAVPESSVPLIINTMSDSMSQGVDIQLRILQTLLSLITNFPSVHGSLLGEALLLCFKLHESRIAVVSSTAAATLRQLVMFVVDKVVEEDHRSDGLLSTQEASLPDGSTKTLGPSAKDAFSIFEDLCLLANSEKPTFLKLESLHKTFALELIESVLTNYHELFRTHEELLMLLQHHLCPLLHKALSDRPIFPLRLRCTRVVFLLLKQFSLELKTEAEVFLILLIKIIGSDVDTNEMTQPPWMRVLAMEIIRGLCIDAEFIRNVWDRYDGQDAGSQVFTPLIASLKRLVMEKPAVLGVGTQMLGVGVSANASDTASSSYGLDVGGVANMVGATVSGVVGMIGSGAGLSAESSAMKLQCIDQLDKADSPPIPESYVYYLGVQSIVSLCEGFATFTGPLYTTLVMQKPRAAGDAVIRAPPALDLSTLPTSEEDRSAKHLRIVRDMIASGWPALLAALSFIISTNLSDELFVAVLSSMQAITNVAGMLALSTPRDAFLANLAKCAIPSRVVSNLASYVEPPTPRTGASISENLGLSAPPQAPGLSERNLACLKVLVSSALYLAGSLGESWYAVLEALQNAEYVLTTKGANTSMRRVSSGMSMSSLTEAKSSSTQSPRHPLLSELDVESVLNGIKKLFDTSKNLEDPAFGDFINALCKLSGEMVSMQTDDLPVLSTIGELDDEPEEAPPTALLSPRPDQSTVHRRRVSGIHLPRTLRTGDFGINKLGNVALLNIHRLIYRSPDIAWNTVTSHLLLVLSSSAAPQSIRTQAARVLDEILVVVPRNLSSTGELQAQVQKRVLDVLSQQIIHDTPSSTSSLVGTDIRRMGLETLHQILQSSSHTLVIGWDVIFRMLASVCRPAIPPSQGVTPSSSPTKRKPSPLGYMNEKNYTVLVKIAFQSLTLVCDSMANLPAEHFRLCITTIGQFGRQADTNIALTAAESLLWSVSDSIQAKRKDTSKDAEYSALWMFLLLEVQGLCTDGRPEVRMGAIQTLFRTLQLYGATLSLETWDECIWKVLFPLLESLTVFVRSNFDQAYDAPASSEARWDDSKILALQSLGSIVKDFLSSKIIHLESFARLWDVFVGYVRETVLLESRSISAPALRSLNVALTVATSVEPGFETKVKHAWEAVWAACDRIGGAIESSKRPSASFNATSTRTFSQESLVAFVDLMRSTRTVSRASGAGEWAIEHLTRLMNILKAIMTYSNSQDYRPDIDSLTPVQSVVMNAISDIDLNVPDAPSLVLQDLAEFVSLAFLAPFEAPVVSSKTVQPPKRITYIALTKKAMPLLVEQFLRFKTSEKIYIDGTVETICTAYSIPIKLKYDCPPPSKHGKDEPLWKTATTSFLHIVKEATSFLTTDGDKLPSERLESVWRQIIDVFRGGILSDSSLSQSFPTEQQDADESFDLSLISTCEIDVFPRLGSARVPDDLIVQLASTLLRGSMLYQLSTHHGAAGVSPSTASSSEWHSVDPERELHIGSTHLGELLPRERFSYWCFDLLFLVCSDISKDQEQARKRVAALSLSSLLSRCRNVMVGYIADESLRGGLPFPRFREDELMYVLRKLLELRVWPGALAASLSPSPSEPLPPIDPSLSPSQLVQEAVKRSPISHLFHFYSPLCEIAAIPRKTPVTWEAQDDSEHFVEVDARILAKQCLQEVGREFGSTTQ